MRGKTRGEAREELLKAGVSGEKLNALIPHKVRGSQFQSISDHLLCSINLYILRSLKEINPQIPLLFRS